MSVHPQKPERKTQHPSTAKDTPAQTTSAEILRGHRELHIEHGGETYRLRVTRSGKLILTK